MKQRGLYDNYTASDLARETRALGLEKPNVITLREWADWLEEQKREQAAAASTSDDRQRRRAEREAALKAMNRDRLEQEVADLGVTLPETGSGTNGRLLVGDIEAALMARWDADNAPAEAPEVGEDGI